MPQRTCGQLLLGDLAADGLLPLHHLALTARDPRPFRPHLACHVVPLLLQLRHRRLLQLEGLPRLLLLRVTPRLMRP
eukprot:scaffold2774_cov87-Phaeocystis_antarctica.AAC.11